MYYSQTGEDCALHQVFQGRANGVCIEVGANNGVNDSNTFFFEKLGWTCVLVEPNPFLCDALKEARTSRLFACAASDHEGRETLHIAVGDARSHGVSSVGSAGVAHVRGFGFEPNPVDVDLRKLDSMLEESGLEAGIDFVSIDVEGHEMQVLRGFDLKRWKPRILLIEDNSNFADQAIRHYLCQRDYVPFRRTGCNDWYARTDDPTLVTMEARWGYEALRLCRRLRARIARIPGATALTRKVRRVLRIGPPAPQ